MKIFHFLGIGHVPKKPLVEGTGGTERVALEIARLQAKRGHKVVVASFGATAWEGEWEGVTLRHLAPVSWGPFGRRARLRALARHSRLALFVLLGRFDMVHFHEYRSTRFLSRQPKVMQFHNNPLGYVAPADLDEAARHYWGELAQSGAQIAVSEFVAERLRLTHEHAGAGAPPAHIVVNQSGVHADGLSPKEMKKARAELRKKLGLRDSDVFFLFAGAVRPEKGVFQLAESFAQLSSTNSDAYLAIAGGSQLWSDGQATEDPTEQQVQQILEPAIQRRRASMLGILSPLMLLSFYAAADVFVLPSMFQETFGLVILEAFSAGLPVIAARSGGIPELVKDGRNGLIVEQGDIPGLLEAMRRLLLDRATREQYGAEGRKTAVAMSWDKTVDRLERIYEAVLKGQAPA